MTENEEKSRKIMDGTVNSEENLLRAALRIAEDGAFPELTDDECRRIAVDYPVSLQEIRDVSPRVKL